MFTDHSFNFSAWLPRRLIHSDSHVDLEVTLQAKYLFQNHSVLWYVDP